MSSTCLTVAGENWESCSSSSSFMSLDTSSLTSLVSLHQPSSQSQRTFFRFASWPPGSSSTTSTWTEGSASWWVTWSSIISQSGVLKEFIVKTPIQLNLSINRSSVWHENDFAYNTTPPHQQKLNNSLQRLPGENSLATTKHNTNSNKDNNHNYNIETET